MTYFLAEANEAREAIQRVRELHEPVDNLFMFKGQACAYCTDMANNYRMYPCDTIKALDSDVNERI